MVTWAAARFDLVQEMMTQETEPTLLFMPHWHPCLSFPIEQGLLWLSVKP